MRILAVILAGGLARRMEGACKPLLALGGRRLIDLVAENARGQGLDVVLNLQALTEDGIAPFKDLGLPMVADAIPDHVGPLAGILAALDEAARKNFDAVLSLPCDTPFLPQDLAQRLSDAGKNLACAASGGRVHPVIGLWPVALRENLRSALIDERIRAPKDFQRRHDCAVVEWPVAPRDPFFNVNTPAELAEAERLLGRPPLRKLDLRGLKCPLPVLKTRKFLGLMAPGERVEVCCTDPMSLVDLPHLLRETGDVLEAQSRAEGVAVFVIRRAP